MLFRSGNRIKQWLAYLKLSYPQAAHFFEEIKRLREPELLEQAFARQLGNSPREIEAA